MSAEIFARVFSGDRAGRAGKVGERETGSGKRPRRRGPAAKPARARRSGAVLALLMTAVLPAGACTLNREGGKSQVEVAPINVRAERPSVRPMEEVIEVQGNLAAKEQVEVPAKVGGTVLAVYVKEGQTVSAGRLLCKIDDAEYRLSLAQAESAYKVAKSDYESGRELYAQGMKSRLETEKQKRVYDDARSSLELGRLRLRNTEVRSPIRGTVIQRNAEPHQQIGSEVLFSVADLSSFKVKITVTEAEIGKVKPGQPVRIRVDAVAKDRDSYPFLGAVSEIQPQVNPQTGTVEVEVALDNPGGLTPGMFARLKVVTDTHPSALVIPRPALSAEDPNHVWVAEGEAARLCEIKTGLTDQEGVEILSGLQPTDLVIVEGHASLTAKSRIAIINGGPTASSPGPAPSPAAGAAPP